VATKPYWVAALWALYVFAVAALALYVSLTAGSPNETVLAIFAIGVLPIAICGTYAYLIEGVWWLLSLIWRNRARPLVIVIVMALVGGWLFLFFAVAPTVSEVRGRLEVVLLTFPAITAAYVARGRLPRRDTS
jgi:hypothetical protein